MTPALVHKTKTLADHTATITLCGIRLTTDHKATQAAKQGPWLSCPLCETALALANIDLGAPESHHLIQVPFEGSESW